MSSGFPYLGYITAGFLDVSAHDVEVVLHGRLHRHGLILLRGQRSYLCLQVRAGAGQLLAQRRQPCNQTRSKAALGLVSGLCLIDGCSLCREAFSTPFGIHEGPFTG